MPRSRGLFARRRFRRQLTISSAIVLLGAGLMSIPFYNVLTGTADGIQPITEVPADNPRLGLLYQGLVPAPAGAPCVGGYEVGDRNTCSHGPDAPPPGLDVKQDVAPVAPAAAPQKLPSTDGSGAPAEDEIAIEDGAVATADGTPAVVEDATPAAAAAEVTVGPHGVVCEGDGKAGKRVQVLYAYDAGTASRYDQYLASFRTWTAGVDTIYSASATETGGERHVRFVTTPDCQPDVAEVELPAGSMATFNATINALRALGFNRTDRKYMIFGESRVYCGIGTFAGDERAGATNRSNGGPSYGRSDSGCWTAGVAAHELGHNLGAVNNSSPNSSKAGHCVDEYDVMCYRDSSGNATRVVCGDRAHDQRMDCNHDDYYHTNPSPGSYLATHWNVADNEFLINGGGGPVPPPPSPSPTRTAGPSPSVSPTRSPTPSPSPTRSPSPSPSRTNTPGPPTSPPPPSPTRTDPVPPSPSPTGSLAALRLTDVAATSMRLAWDPAPDATRYAVQLNGRTIGFARSTAVRLVGLRPDTGYTVQVALRRADRTLTPYTQAVSVRTAAAIRPPAGSWFTLANSLTGGAADVYAARSGDGAPIILYRRHDGANQRWQLQPAGTDTFLVRAQSSDKCLMPMGGTARAGAPLVQQTCDAAAAGQQWRLVDTEYGFALRTASGDLAVGVGNSRYRGCRLLVLQRPNERRYQSWTAA